jgi:hypothetical protein
MTNKPPINKKRVFFLLFIFPFVFLFILILPSLVSAQDPITNPALDISLTSLSGSEFFSGLVSALLTLFFVIGAIVFVFIIVIGAVGWISSGGDKVANENARKKITNAAIGLVILFSLFAVINLIEYFFGTDITSFNITDISIPPTTPGPTAIPTIPYEANCNDACVTAGHASGYCYGGGTTCPLDHIFNTESCARPEHICCCRPQPTATTAPTATPTPTLAPDTCQCNSRVVLSSNCDASEIPTCTQPNTCLCQSPTNITVDFCNDSDGGEFNWEVAGVAMGDSYGGVVDWVYGSEDHSNCSLTHPGIDYSIVRDCCMSPNQIIEGACDMGALVSNSRNCTCINGACVPLEP